MNAIVKWVGFLSALMGILSFLFNLFTGTPFNLLLFFSQHRLADVSQSSEFKIETILTSSGNVINPSDKFNYLFHLPLQVKGTTKFGDAETIWTILQDEDGSYYLQNPPIVIRNGEWRSFGIKPLRGIKRIIWLKGDREGNAFFARKQNCGEWGKFITLPQNSIEVGSIDLM